MHPQIILRVSLRSSAVLYPTHTRRRLARLSIEAGAFRAGCLEAGYEDYQQIREDPDLEGVRGDSRFQSLISKYAKSNGNGFFGNMLKGFKL